MTMAPYSLSDAMTGEPTIDAITVEIDAMQTIARALGGIRDPEARQRVLQWVNERFSMRAHGDATSAHAEAMEPDGDSALGVDMLDDLFENPLAFIATPASHLGESEFPDFEVAEPIVAEPMFTEADLTELDLLEPAVAQLAIAEATVAQAAIEEQAAAEQRAAAQQSVAEPVVAGPDDEAPARAAREEQALDTLVKGFASDLQRLAVEWQTP
jgi:hypothetical protein